MNIPMNWDEASGTFTVGRRGSFPEMLKERGIRVGLVSKDKAVGSASTRRR